MAVSGAATAKASRAVALSEAGINDPFIHALIKVLGEARLNEGENPRYPAANAPPSPTLVPSSPQNDGPALPMATPGDNISPDMPVTRWMSV